MRVKTNGLLFLTSAFPFIIPLIPSTDTQPTFTLFTLLFAAAAVVQSFNRDVLLSKRDLMLAAAIFSGGICWLCLSISMNNFVAGNINRLVSFIMFLIALSTGLLNRHIFTSDRVTTALKAYWFFTLLFIVTRGKLEGLIIRSRGEEAMARLSKSGRGASTLSPEPSFFAFQIFTLFLIVRLTIWDRFSRRGQHFVQLSSIGLLISTLGGYGMLYALIVIFLSGRRYIFGFGLAGSAALALVASIYSIDSLRFAKLFLSILSSFSSGFELKDVSILVRLTSLQEYLEVFGKNALFGDAFKFYGGGGLVSLLAGLGLYGLLLMVTIIAAILFSGTGWRMKVALLSWVAFQFISGPIGLPFIGLLIGIILSHARFGAIFSVFNILLTRRQKARAQFSSFTQGVGALSEPRQPT